MNVHLVHEIMKNTWIHSSDDFCRIRQDEARFELLVDEALITGSIDLLLKEDKLKNINAAEVIDFKSNGSSRWIRVSLIGVKCHHKYNCGSRASQKKL